MWIYTKLYFARGEALERRSEDFLAERFSPLVAELAQAGAIDQMHFLRYVDEGYHLRLRLKTQAGAAALVHDKLMALAGRGETMVPATYEAEVAKYGGDAGVEIAERWFTMSSILALTILKSSSGTAARAAIAQYVLADLLARITSELEAQRALLRQYRAIWTSYATVPAEIEPTRPLPSAFEAPLADWTRACRRVETAYRALAADGRLTAPLASILLNVAHLLNNRIGLGPAYELALADRLLAHVHSYANAHAHVHDAG